MAHSVYSADVTQESFETDVLERSRTVPVLVDFWAAWCGPCKMLMPMLAKLAEEYQGRFFLAKVNSDEQQELATRYGIRSLPTIKLFSNGAVVGEFVGVQPERSIRALLDRHIARPSDRLVHEALEAEARGDAAGALDILRRVHSEDAANDRAIVHLGRMLLEQGADTQAEQILARISPAGRADPDLAPLLTRLEFIRMTVAAPPLAELEKRVQAQPGDMQARHWLGARYLLAGHYEAALEQWLTMVRENRQFGNDAGRKALLAAFNFLGGKGELVRKYRNLLSLALN
ncbi:MAG: thioredoxin [Gammaproteobacteria bacterium]|nr:thioredoxin [Gammaproteobacteria bacterium]